MDTVLSFLQSMTSGGDGQHALFLLVTGATAFLFALGVAFLVLATLDPVRRRLGEISADNQNRSELATRILGVLEPISRYLTPSKGGLFRRPHAFAIEPGVLKRTLIY